MKKLRIDLRFWLTAAFCTALLAVPPLAVRASDRQAETSLPRPGISGTMNDDQRLDPVVSALYRQRILTDDGHFVDEYNTLYHPQMIGKLRQAKSRGLLSEAQLDYLIAIIEKAEAQVDFPLGLNYCTLYTDNAGVEHLSLTASFLTQEQIDAAQTHIPIDAGISISYLADNGPILELNIFSCYDFPPDEIDEDTLLENFISQLKLTVPGEWEQAGEAGRSHKNANITASYNNTAGQRDLLVALSTLNPQ